MKKIDDNLLSVTNVMFKNRNDWKYVTEEQKIKYFFIINRLLSKNYPQISQLLNDKCIDNSIGLDLIFQFMKDKPYPKWFWSKSEKNKNGNFSEEELNLIKKNLELKDSELEFLINFHIEELRQELKYLNSLYK